jgi:hypothetical protein
MDEIIDKLKCSKESACYFTIPKKIMREMKIKPFMTAHMKAKKDKIIIEKFSKTVEIKIELDKQTIKIIKKIMKLEGYASMDETICNAIHNLIKKNPKEKIIFIYPEDYFEKKYSLIDDYKKAKKTKTNKTKTNKTKTNKTKTNKTKKLVPKHLK